MKTMIFEINMLPEILKTKNKETLQMFPLKIHTCVKSTFECKTNIPCTQKGTQRKMDKIQKAGVGTGTW